MDHSDDVVTMDFRAMFDHDQEDGKSKTEPYLDDVRIEICKSCRDYMFENKRLVYAYGAMGHNKYYLK